MIEIIITVTLMTEALMILRLVVMIRIIIMIVIIVIIIIVVITNEWKFQNNKLVGEKWGIE